MTHPLENAIGYVFTQKHLLKLALAHPSLNREQSNQRLEFLGDGVLGMVVARLLYDLYPKESEGELARRQAALVCGATLAKVARDIELGKQIDMAGSEISAGGRDNASNLEDACEALIGAMYLDGGFAVAEKFIVSRWMKLAKEIQTPPKDAKTQLQEWAQARGLDVPAYRIENQTGPAHAPEFIIVVEIDGQPPQRGMAGNKRVAEQAAAATMLTALGEKKND